MVGDFSLFVTRVKINDSSNGNKFICMIMQEVSNGVSIPHPISRYIFAEFGRDTLATQKNHAQIVVEFLNYIRKDSSVERLGDINKEHADRFMSSKVSEGLKRSSLDSIERRLSRFLTYCTKQELIDMDKEKDFVTVLTRSGEKNVYRAGIVMPEKKPSDKIHMIQPQFIPLFIETAVRESPDIAFGLILMFYGGLRVGEVCTLTKSAIKINSMGKSRMLSVTIATRVLRDDIPTGASKAPRNQFIPVEFNGTVENIYNIHLRRYSGGKGNNALFVNRDKNPMSTDSFGSRFRRVKREFLEALRKSGIPGAREYAAELESKKWATHIGRGTFSNLLAIAGVTLNQLAAARGDKSYTSSMVYIDQAPAAVAEVARLNQIAWDEYHAKKDK